eukprot:gb/GECH01015041.1/.p1 GENE.gb/GECH01015041.1/~~gb/GECH01015041.1/.p1  ORF type:complete len:342 (+),score=38.31 gb/GECH01015041.1/:1-1026(+)
MYQASPAPSPPVSPTTSTFNSINNNNSFPSTATTTTTTKSSTSHNNETVTLSSSSEKPDNSSDSLPNNSTQKDDEQNNNQSHYDLKNIFLSLFRAGINSCTRFVLYPIARVKYVQQVYGKNVGVKILVSMGGLRNLFQGAKWEMLGIPRWGIGIFSDYIASNINQLVPGFPSSLKDILGPVCFTTLISPFSTIHSIYASDAENRFESYSTVAKAVLEERGVSGFFEGAIPSILELYLHRKACRKLDEMRQAYARTVNTNTLFDRILVFTFNVMVLLAARAVCYPLQLLSTDMVAANLNNHYGNHTGLSLVYYIIKHRRLGLWDGIQFSILYDLLFSFLYLY